MSVRAIVLEGCGNCLQEGSFICLVAEGYQVPPRVKFSVGLLRVPPRTNASSSDLRESKEEAVMSFMI